MVRRDWFAVADTINAQAEFRLFLGWVGLSPLHDLER
jgi:hypothetical protein